MGNPEFREGRNLKKRGWAPKYNLKELKHYKTGGGFCVQQILNAKNEGFKLENDKGLTHDSIIYQPLV